MTNWNIGGQIKFRIISKWWCWGGAKVITVRHLWCVLGLAHFFIFIANKELFIAHYCRTCRKTTIFSSDWSHYWRIERRVKGRIDPTIIKLQASHIHNLLWWELSEKSRALFSLAIIIHTCATSMHAQYALCINTHLADKWNGAEQRDLFYTCLPLTCKCKHTSQSLGTCVDSVTLVHWDPKGKLTHETLNPAVLSLGVA